MHKPTEGNKVVKCGLTENVGWKEVTSFTTIRVCICLNVCK